MENVYSSEIAELTAEPVHQMAMLIPTDYDPVGQLEQAQRVVQFMSDKCSGPNYISNISGRNYPRVDWWTTVGMSLSLFPVEESVEKVETGDNGEIKYEAVVSVRRSGQVITRASHVASSREGKPWGHNDYSVRSMAVTRATGKAYRIGLSGLAVLAGLEPTPAEEMPTTGQPVEAARTPRAVAPPPSPDQVQEFFDLIEWGVAEGIVDPQVKKTAQDWIAAGQAAGAVGAKIREWREKKENELKVNKKATEKPRPKKRAKKAEAKTTTSSSDPVTDLINTIRLSDPAAPVGKGIVTSINDLPLSPDELSAVYLALREASDPEKILDEADYPYHDLTGEMVVDILERVKESFERNLVTVRQR